MDDFGFLANRFCDLDVCLDIVLQKGFFYQLLKLNHDGLTPFINADDTYSLQRVSCEGMRTLIGSTLYIKRIFRTREHGITGVFYVQQRADELD